MLRPVLRSAAQPALRSAVRLAAGSSVAAPTGLAAEYVAVFAPTNVTVAEV